MKSRKNFNIKNNINNYYKQNKVLNKNIGPKLSSYKLKKSDYQKENIKKIQKNSNLKSNKIEDLLLNNKNQINKLKEDLIKKHVKKMEEKMKIQMQEEFTKIKFEIMKLLNEEIKRLKSIFNNLHGIYEG